MPIIRPISHGASVTQANTCPFSEHATQAYLLRWLLLLSLLTLAACGMLSQNSVHHSPKPLSSSDNWNLSDQDRPIQEKQAALKYSDLKQWWGQFNDPILQGLIEAAQQNSSNLAEAYQRISAARAVFVNADAMGLTGVDLAVSAERKAFSFGGPPTFISQKQIKFESQWELDLFGGLKSQRLQATASLASRQAEWHDARISIAAEVANQYGQLRFCQRRAELQVKLVNSKHAVYRLMMSRYANGMSSEAETTPLRTALNEASAQLRQQQSSCQVAVKGLVALTGLEEAELRSRLLQGLPEIPRPPAFSIQALPVALLESRPDLLAAEREMQAASAQITVKRADQLPKISLLGFIAPVRFDVGGSSLTTTTWSIGPTLQLPLADLGRRKSLLIAAQDQLLAAEAKYRQKARDAVKEVEQAMLRLHALEQQTQFSEETVQAYQRNVALSASRLQAGMDSQIDYETRVAEQLQASQALSELHFETLTAWIALYKAVGAGWSSTDMESIYKSTVQP